jgi:hypothetical protein
MAIDAERSTKTRSENPGLLMTAGF